MLTPDQSFEAVSVATDKLSTAATGGIGGVTIYARLAAALRVRIARGDWKIGDRLPSVAALAAEMKVGQVTVRHAYARLAAEGLIESRRGRGTHVCGVPPIRSDGLRSAINSDLVDPAELKINILEVDRDVSLPVSLQDTGAGGELYVRIRKLHIYRGVPFCYIEIFVRQSVYEQFPADAVRTHKVNSLVRQVAADAVLDGVLTQRITLEPAQGGVAQLLHYEEMAPLAVVRRVLRSGSNEILSAGYSYYRSDQFVLESEVPALLTESYPALSNPARRG